MAGLLTAAPAALAITAEDVMTRMNSDQRTSFLSGAVDMYSLITAKNGDSAKANCAIAWFFESGEALREIFAVFGNYGEQDAVSVLEVLINRHC